jgi:ADP-heptose:LPS heptosyltransferase/GT2 family glycosyltransferase
VSPGPRSGGQRSKPRAGRAADAAAALAPPPRLSIEHPQDGVVLPLGERLHWFGWVLGTGKVIALEVALDGVKLCAGTAGLPRADLDDVLATLPGAQPPGFSFGADLPPRQPGPAVLEVIARTAGGTAAATVNIVLVDKIAAAPPEGLAPIRLVVERTWLTPGGTFHVGGWAASWRGLDRLELRQGETVLGVGVVGLSRDDVAAALPDYPDAGTSGFELAVPIGPQTGSAGVFSVLAVDRAGASAVAACEALEFAAGGGPAGGAASFPPLLARLEEAAVDADGLLRLRGWAVGPSPVELVAASVGTLDLGAAELNLHRADVAAAYPDFPSAGTSGFLLRQAIDPARLPPDPVVRLSVVAADGTRQELSGPLAVAEGASRPAPQEAEVLLHCDTAALWTSGAVRVEGWALCADGVAELEIALGGRVLGPAEYGHDRPDVGNAYPLIQGSRRSGFRFAGHAGMACTGEHTIRVQARGAGGLARALDLPSTAAPGAPPVSDTAPSGLRYFLDLPVVRDGRAAEPVRGFLSLSGWAYSAAGVTAIDVFADGRPLGQAYRGIRREDLHRHTGAAEALRAGFAMLVPPAALRRGEHEVRIVIRDAVGEQAEIEFALLAEPDLSGDGPWTLRRKMTEAEADQARAIVAAAGGPDRIDVVLASTDATPDETRDSLRAQAWQDWRVLPCDAGETDGAPLLLRLGPGDVLGEDGLQEFAVAAALSPAAEFFYADECRPDPAADGETRPFFKPDFSPDLLLSANYIGRTWAVRPALLARAGLTPADLAAGGDLDLVLRLTEQAGGIVHIPRVLSARGTAPDESAGREQAALQAALARRGEAAGVEPGLAPGTWRIRRRIVRDELVSVIIPTAGSRGLIRRAIESLRAHADGRRIEIVVVDNIPAELEGGEGLRQWLEDSADTVVFVREPFNWARFNNLAAMQARGEMLLFLNDDIEATHAGWLDALVAHAQRPEVGAAGALLLYPDGKVQHAGQFLAGRIGRHAFRFSPADEPGPFGLAMTERNVISVTGACLATRRDVFDALGGFDPRHAVVNNDLDYCLRVREAGLRVIYTPHARLVHHEMASREALPDAHDASHFAQRWAELFALGDPYFSPHLSTQSDDYVPEREPVRAQHVGRPLIARARVRRILALKLDHLGDFVCAFPAFRRLKQHFPDAELTVLAAGGPTSLAPLERAIDRLLRFDFYHARSELGRRTLGRAELEALEAMLLPHRFDLAIDLRRQPDTREILRHSGARWLAGLDHDATMPFLDIAVEWEGDMARTRKRLHVSDALIALVDAVAMACEDAAPLAIPQEIPAALPEGLPAGDGPLVAIHAGAGAANKTWPAERFAALIDLLAARHAARAVLIGGPDDAAIAQSVLAALAQSATATSLAGQMPLSDLPAVLRHCDLYIGNDSGPKHIAAALGVPTLGIHGGAVVATEWAPVGPATLALRRDVVCSPCYLALAADCHREPACLHGIGVGDAYRAAIRLLALRRPHGGGNGIAKDERA